MVTNRSDHEVAGTPSGAYGCGMSQLPPNAEIQTVTSLSVSPAEDRAYRQKVYLISMSLRVLCFLGSIFLPVPMQVRLILVAGAILLPYFAVVAANAARRRNDGSPAAVTDPSVGSSGANTRALN
jgi:hypothetical protein